MTNRCHFCHGFESAETSLFEEVFFTDLFICNHCWTSEKVNAWREKMMAENSVYRAYMQNITAGYRVSCPACGQVVGRYPKLSGHSPVWEMCCTQCEKVSAGLSPYEYDLTEWERVYEQYMRAALDVDSHWSQLEEMATALGYTPEKCPCGGEYSMLAKPRCPRCKAVVSDSLFHVCDEQYA